MLNVIHIFNKCLNSLIFPSYIRFDVITREQNRQSKASACYHRMPKSKKTCRSTPRSGNFTCIKFLARLFVCFLYEASISKPQHRVFFSFVFPVTKKHSARYNGKKFAPKNYYLNLFTFGEIVP
jgi:hypothetical protein